MPGHNALGTHSAIGGWSWVGEHGPEMMYLPTGAQITPAFRTGQHLAQGAMGGVHVHHVTVELDGRQIAATVKKATYQYNANNGNRDNQGRLRGNWSPRGTG
jgi:phage-related tail protein